MKGNPKNHHDEYKIHNEHKIHNEYKIEIEARQLI